jgi:hypothetical protein
VKELREFIADIQNNTITQNEITICAIEDDLIIALERIGVQLHSKDIILTVRRYMHIMRDIKKKRGSAVSNEIICNLYTYLKSPLSVYFDTNPKHNNLMYINQYNQQLFKIVVNLHTNIITAGTIHESNLRDKFLVRVK